MLSTTSEYALRALACLASVSEGRVCMGRDLSARIGVPSSYLAKILNQLGKASIVEATRGLRGGYRLKIPPEDIRLIDVVELFDGPRTLPECFFDGTRKCSDETPCPAHERWKKVRNAYVQFLEETRVSDISVDGGDL